VEQVTAPEQAEKLLHIWRSADHVSLLALPDLTGVSVFCQTGSNSAIAAELFFEKYQGDWNALLTTLFSADIKKVSHNVKDLMRTLLENGLPADGFLFDTALAAYGSGGRDHNLRQRCTDRNYGRTHDDLRDVETVRNAHSAVDKPIAALDHQHQTK
jgi:DNA polymerase I-like protein with 3'-5' exonuclease and polymerase domains